MIYLCEVYGVVNTDKEKAPGVSYKLVLGEYSLGIEGYGVTEYEKCSDDGWQYFSRLGKCLSSLTIHQKLVRHAYSPNIKLKINISNESFWD